MSENIILKKNTDFKQQKYSNNSASKIFIT